MPSAKLPRSCGFLIIRGTPIDSFLLMQHPDRWDLPKGHVDPGESDLEAALRELEEETGFAESDIEVVPGFVYEQKYPVAGGRYGLSVPSVEKTLRIFMAKLLNPMDPTVTEHDSFRWFDWNPPHRIQQRTIDPLLDQAHLFMDGAR